MTATDLRNPGSDPASPASPAASLPSSWPPAAALHRLEQSLAAVLEQSLTDPTDRATALLERWAAALDRCGVWLIRPVHRMDGRREVRGAGGRRLVGLRGEPGWSALYARLMTGVGPIGPVEQPVPRAVWIALPEPTGAAILVWLPEPVALDLAATARRMGPLRHLSARVLATAPPLSGPTVESGFGLDDRSRYLMAHLNAGIVISQENRVRYANPWALTIFGTDEAEMLRRPTTSWLTAESQATLSTWRLKRSLGEMVAHTLELYAQRTDGQIRTLEVTFSPIIERGEPAILQLILDVTEQRRTELRYRQLFESSADMLMTVDQETGRVREVNRQFQTITGWPQGEVIGRNFFTLLAPRDRESTQARYRRRLASDSREAARAVVNLIRADGSELTVDLAARYQATEGVLLVAARDLTEQRALQARHEATEQRYGALFEQSVDSLFLVDHATGAVVDLNPTAVQTYGWTARELIGQPVTTIAATAADMQSIATALARLRLGSKVTLHLNGRHRRHDGSVLDIEGRLKRIDGGGGPLLLLSVRDVSERLRLEQQLIYAQKMESVGTLAGGVAHDFNNILAIVMGYSALLQQRAADPDKVRHYAESIHKATTRAAELTKQLLAFSRHTPTVMRPVQINNIVRELVTLLGETLDRHIALEVDLTGELTVVQADSTLLYQAMLNIAINARDAMPEGGKLRIRTARPLLSRLEARKLFDAPAGRYVTIELTDTGQGMDEDTLRKAFEPFFTTKEPGKGTGLGLSTTYGIIKSHGGYIDVQSAVDVGTTFCLYLPAGERATVGDGQGQAPEIGSMPGAGEVLLLVDDEQQIRAFGRDMLEELKYQVVTAEDGDRAVELYRQIYAAVDLVLLDVAMPNLDGLGTLRKLQEINPQVRVVVLSGYSAGERLEKLMAAGALAVVHKPFEMDELSHALRRVLAG